MRTLSQHLPVALVVTALAMHVHPPVVRADDAEGRHENRWSRRFLLAVNAGIGAPLGVGIEGQYNPWPFFGIAAGGGANGDGIQAMVALRPRLVIGDVAIAFGAAWSTGREVQTSEPSMLDVSGDDDRPDYLREWKFAHWASFEVGVEARPVVGLQLRPYLGITQLLNPGDAECTGDPEACGPDSRHPPTETYPFIGLALGVVL